MTTETKDQAAPAPPTTIPDVARYSRGAQRDWFARQSHERRERYITAAKAEAARLEQHDATDADIENYAIVLAVREYSRWRATKLGTPPSAPAADTERVAPRAGRGDVPSELLQKTARVLSWLERRVVSDAEAVKMDADEMKRHPGLEEEVDLAQQLRRILRDRLQTYAAPNGKGSVTVGATRVSPSVNLPVQTARSYLHYLIDGGHAHAWDWLRATLSPREEQPHWSELAERP